MRICVLIENGFDLMFDDAYALALQMHNPPQAETQK